MVASNLTIVCSFLSAHHSRGHKDVGLVTRLKPFVQIFRSRITTSYGVCRQAEICGRSDPVVGRVRRQEDIMRLRCAGNGRIRHFGGSFSSNEIERTIRRRICWQERPLDFGTCSFVAGDVEGAVSLIYEAQAVNNLTIRKQNSGRSREEGQTRIDKAWDYVRRPRSRVDEV